MSPTSYQTAPRYRNEKAAEANLGGLWVDGGESRVVNVALFLSFLSTGSSCAKQAYPWASRVPVKIAVLRSTSPSSQPSEHGKCYGTSALPYGARCSPILS
jgi:hypothetical protein